MAPPRQATMTRLHARHVTPVVTGHPLSVISLVMLSVGGGALLLSITLVSVYFYHVRRRRRRLRARRNSLAEKIGEPVLMHAPHHAQTAIDLKSMTPAMRLAHSTRTADMQRVQRAQEANAAHAQAALIAAQQWAAPLDNVAIDSSRGFQQHVSPRSSTEHSRPSLSVPHAPPLPYDSQVRIQLARQQSIISQQSSHKSQKSQKSITFVEPVKPSKAASAPNANPYPSVASSSRTATVMPAQAIPHLPAMTERAPQLTANRSLSPLPAPSILESESYTPVLDFGMEFGKSKETGATDVGEARKGRDSQMLQDPHSWLASALDSAFNVSALATDESMFSEKPRQAPPRPIETVTHTSRPSVSSFSASSHGAAKASKKTAAPPPPAFGPPQKFVKPTPGGAARVTVDYYTPYQRRTLYQSDDIDAAVVDAIMGGTRFADERDAVEIVRDGNEIPPRPSTQLSGRTSIESSMRAAALFSVMEPALRSSSETQKRQQEPCILDADISATSTVSTTASSQERYFSNRRAGDSTADTSVQIDHSDHTDEEKRIAITAVDHISPIAGTFVSPHAISEPLGSMWSVPSSSAQPTLTKSPTIGSTLVPSKSGFASTLRAKFNISRPRSAASSSAGTASPKWSQKSPTINQSSAFPPSIEMSPALSSTTKETPPNSFGPPTLTWNVSTEDVDTPVFIQKVGMRSQTSLTAASNASNATPMIGLGLRRGSDDTEQTGAAALPTVKALSIADRPHARPSHAPAERTRSISSQTSSKKSQDRYRAFPWSRTTGGPPSSTHGHASTLGGHDNNEYEDADEEDGRSSPRFADADSPSTSPMRAAIASSAGHASSGHARAIDDGGRWTLNRSAPANPRDSMASSCCDTIASSVTGHSDNYSAFEHGNAQVQRAKLLESVQARKQAKGGKASVAKSQGFTSHSASLSIEMGSGPSADGAVKPKQSFLGGMLDVNISQPFMTGDGILTPPLTPFQATIGLPETDGVHTQQQPPSLKPFTPPPHARIRAPNQTQSSPTPEQRQAERMSKLRPLSLAASHPQQAGVSTVGAGPRMPLNATRKSVASSRTNSVAHGGGVTASSSYASMATSSSSGSGSLNANHQASLAVIRQSSHSMASAHNGIQLPSISYKRVSRAGSTTSSHAMQHGPMGAIHGPGLSISTSPNVPTIGVPSADFASFRNGSTSTRAKPQGPTHVWLAASNAGLMSSSLDAPSTSSNLSSAAMARLSGSSFASHSSILARFPALANGMTGVQEATTATAV